MKTRFNFLTLPLLILLSFTACHQKRPMTCEQSISTGWMFAKEGDSSFFTASVPGTVHTDLHQNKLIPDPFLSCNEAHLQWIGKTDWIYKTTFDVKQALFDSENIRLRFGGLDTYASVKLNGETILEADNMFREWQVDCKKILKEKNNSLEIKFISALNKYKTDSANAGIFIPGGKWVYARKAPYHFGWDWGPTFITAGIWKPVSLIAWNQTIARNWFIQTTEINTDKANLKLSVDVESKTSQKADILVRNKNNDTLLLKTAFNLEEGGNTYDFDFSIDNPKWWWSNGLGEPYLYAIEIELTTASGESTATTINHGIRSLKLISQPDSTGSSFYFELNGRPVFAKGANYIPQHSFVTEITEGDYASLVEQAKASNINMLRVWGGGIYEQDLFYDLCDRNGIMVWQDFMFACSMIPGDDHFVRNVRIEAIDQITRLRNHPSIALWCGNNEADEGWHNWGWQKQHILSDAAQERLWGDYSKVFKQLLPNLVEQYAPKTDYISTSPLHGWGRKESMTNGDSHYWGVWWGKEPFEKYLEKVPRFMSEFGFQALPAMSTIRSFQTFTSDSIITAELKCHQKHPVGYETIEIYLQREKLFPKNLQNLIFTSQLIQQQGIGLGIEAQRSAFPKCMGSLYWQLNDVWPVTSWSGLDSEGVWKALQYRVRELYNPLMLSALQIGDSLKLTLLNERNKAESGTLTATKINFNGLKQELFRKEISISENRLWQQIVPLTTLMTEQEKSETVLCFRFESSDGEVVEEFHFATKFGQLHLPKTKLQTSVTKVEGGFEINITANLFTAFLQLYLTDTVAYFNENFFHLEAGETKSVFCKTSLKDIEAFQNQLKTMSLNAFLNDNPTNNITN